MERRNLLRNGLGALALGLAGCAEDEGTPASMDTPAETSSPGMTPTDSPTETRTETATDTPARTTDGTPTETETETPTETEMATETATETATDTPDATPTETPTPTSTPTTDQTVAVGPNGTLTFQPAEFTIQAGDTVLWEWESSGHNVKPSSTPDGSDWEGTPGGESKTYDEGYTYRYTFDVTGSYDYYCNPHRQAGMTGSFDVE